MDECLQGIVDLFEGAIETVSELRKLDSGVYDSADESSFHDKLIHLDDLIWFINGDLQKVRNNYFHDEPFPETWTTSRKKS